MNLLDLKSQDAICCTKNYNYIYKIKDSLLLGKDQHHDYMTYLYFNLPPYFYLKKLEQARLLLFKIPPKIEEHQAYFKNHHTDYHIYPLLDFFNIYSNLYHLPRIDSSRKISFEDTGYYSYTEVDITSIVRGWINDEIENKGIVIMGGYDTQIITYASNCFGITGMRPRLRLIYEESCICPPLSEATCSVEIGG